MCNGDLGMYRVMPWAYPTIPGQSSGGTSVDPTPEPSVEVYDFSGASAKWSIDTVKFDSYTETKCRAFPLLYISGISAIDTSSVSSTVVKTKTQPNYSISLTNADLVVAWSPSNVSSPNGNPGAQLLADASDAGKTVTVSGGSIEIVAYDADGNILQSHELVIT